MMENESSPLQTGVACRAEDARPNDVCSDAARPEPAYPEPAYPDAENPDDESPDTVEEEDGALFEHFRFVVDKGQSLMRADKYLSSHMESTSRNRIQLAIDAGYVMANGKVIKSNYKVKPLDILTIAFPYRRHESEIKPENIPLDIVYEDDALLVVNKPAGLVVHPGHGHFSGTLINALAYHLNLGTRPMKQRFGSVTGSGAANGSNAEAGNSGAANGSNAEAADSSAAGNSGAANGSNAEAGNSSAANGSNAATGSSAAAEEMPEGCRFNRGEADERMGVLVHRIDMNTSGLLVVAKSEYAQIQLAKQFFHHTIERKYVALVWGNMESDSGTIVGNIARDPNDRLRYRVVEDGSGKHAVTHYRVLERFGYVTLVECQLETGRTHQIRVHMNHIGHPLFNDDRYGGDRIRKGTLYTKYKQFIENCFEVMPRHALHAKTLGFEHPITGKHIFLESALPDDFTAVIEKWRKRICTT